jgi:hypothetical protein
MSAAPYSAVGAFEDGGNRRCRSSLGARSTSCVCSPFAGWTSSASLGTSRPADGLGRRSRVAWHCVGFYRYAEQEGLPERVTSSSEGLKRGNYVPGAGVVSK